MPGATSDTISLTNLSLSQSGAYSVVISNAYGGATSAVARLTINSIALNGHLVSGNVTVTNSALVEIAGYPNGAIFYTLDGDYPGTGQLYYGPFTLSSSAVLRAIGYSADYSVSAEVPAVNITVVHGPTMIAQPESQTRLAGPRNTDGVRGASAFSSD